MEIVVRFREWVRRLVFWSEVFRGAYQLDSFTGDAQANICRTYGALCFKDIFPVLTLQLCSGQARWANVCRASGAWWKRKPAPVEPKGEAPIVVDRAWTEREENTRTLKSEGCGTQVFGKEEGI